MLTIAGMFFDDDPDDSDFKQTLNLNDAMCWGCVDGEYVPDDKLCEVASLFIEFGNAGILYWVSKQRGWERAEFLDVNRMIDFVKHEKELVEKIPDSSRRAYEKISYTLGET